MPRFDRSYPGSTLRVYWFDSRNPIRNPQKFLTGCSFQFVYYLGLRILVLLRDHYFPLQRPETLPGRTGAGGHGTFNGYDFNHPCGPDAADGNQAILKNRLNTGENSKMSKSRKI